MEEFEDDEDANENPKDGVYWMFVGLGIVLATVVVSACFVIYLLFGR